MHPAAVPPQRETDDGYNRRRAPSRYQEQASTRPVAYSSDHPPVARAYSTRPDAGRREMLPGYAAARAGSVMPNERYSRQSEMAPPSLPVMRRRDAPEADDGYRYAATSDGREQFDDRRSVSYRY